MHMLMGLLMAGSVLSTAPEDSRLHFGACGAISAVTYGLARQVGMRRPAAYVTGLSLAIMVGVIKERNDKIFDKSDLGYDILGAVTVPLIFINF